MEKQIVKVESLLTVISPQQTVRIMDDTLSKNGAGADPEEITLFKGAAVKAFREFAGKGATIKHISPEVERETDAEAPRYVMHIFIYRNSAR
ncbi:hypothetical protein B5F29_14610 [Lachnoclostridium sp. An196]|jgi:hypothetical protein|uniref:hypothetical protein n=1 Tax=Lachnoclostridium sp. An196 TaxID=1965583 RepID=UPI000B369D02|nr:hypothetical protein [Lachnoclostridium sp. An196]OUP16449.1 hypothetical protein B5F29_14610 [Lachnoclostridium sp. An196]